MSPEQLSVRELKSLLDKRGIYYKDCVEKKDLAKRLKVHACDGAIDGLFVVAGFSPSACPKDERRSQLDLMHSDFGLAGLHGRCYVLLRRQRGNRYRSGAPLFKHDAVQAWRPCRC